MAPWGGACPMRAVCSPSVGSRAGSRVTALRDPTVSGASWPEGIPDNRLLHCLRHPAVNTSCVPRPQCGLKLAGRLICMTKSSLPGTLTPASVGGVVNVSQQETSTSPPMATPCHLLP